MKYEILHQDAFPVVQFDVMLAMSANLDIITAARGAGSVLLGHSLPSGGVNT